MIFWRVTLPFLAGYFVSYVYRSINAMIGPELAREFGLGPGGLGLLTAIFFVSFALFQLPLGVLLDRYGPRRMSSVLLLIAAAGGLWFSLAGSGAELTLARALIGVGASAGLMSCLAAFALWYPAERLATMNSVAFAAGILGAIAVSVPLEVALRSFTWRESFYAVVALTVVVSLLVLLVVPQRAAARRGESLGEQLRQMRSLARDPAFWRIALCMGATQSAVVSLGTLWVATWLRDLAGYTQAGVARALLLFGVSMIAGYIVFGRAADLQVRRGRSALPVLAGGVAASSLCLAALALGAQTGALLLWCLFFGSATAVVLTYSVVTRRYPATMAGRANTALNLCGFAGMFSGQWAVGLVLNLWPSSASGYAPEAYAWALGMLWLVQAAGLAWLWQGRRLLAAV